MKSDGFILEGRLGSTWLLALGPDDHAALRAQICVAIERALSLSTTLVVRLSDGDYDVDLVVLPDALVMPVVRIERVAGRLGAAGDGPVR